MKVYGFSFIKNAVLLDYPIQEAILSILPLCDVVYVAVGKSEDETLELVNQINPAKIKTFTTEWDAALRKGGKVLAVETDKAYASIPEDADWCIYIQGDEVIPEFCHENMRQAMEKYKNDKQVEGLLFKYLHFYGSYDYVGDSSGWYRREIRILRKHKDIFSYKDAQGFRMSPNRKLKVKEIDAYVYHYGWVRDPRKLNRKNATMQNFWNENVTSNPELASQSEFDYSSIKSLKRFEGKHPIVMQNRIARINWKFDHDISTNRYKFKDKFKFFIEKWTGYRPFEHKNYQKI